MELLKAGWLEDPYLKEMWIDFFSAICLWQYNSCDRIITLSQGNKYLEVEYGARAEKIMVVPNGIEVARFKEARCSRCTKDPRMVGFVGRVDNVKDIKTFLQVMAIVKKEYQKVEAWIIGPTDNQPEYYTECTELLDILGLNDTITFTGIADVLDYYKKMDVLVLTSIKEAMPLVVMEAMACGIPVVTTDVGACNELVYGIDDSIGPAGIVARIRDVQAIAAATVKILKDGKLANDFGENGIKRIEQLYREDLIIKQYFNIYIRRNLMAGISFLLKKHIKRPHLASFLMTETEQASQAVGALVPDHFLPGCDGIVGQSCHRQVPNAVFSCDYLCNGSFFSHFISCIYCTQPFFSGRTFFQKN